MDWQLDSFNNLYSAFGLYRMMTKIGQGAARPKFLQLLLLVVEEVEIPPVYLITPVSLKRKRKRMLCQLKAWSNWPR